jgi:hypothetical protein
MGSLGLADTGAGVLLDFPQPARAKARKQGARRASMRSDFFAVMVFEKIIVKLKSRGFAAVF